VTFVEHDPVDDELRDALYSTRPSHSVRLDNIDHNIVRLRRRAFLHAAGGAALLVAAVVFVGSALSPRDGTRSLNIQPPLNTTAQSARTVPVSVPAPPVSGPKSPGPRIITPAPSPTTVQSRPQPRTIHTAPPVSPRNSVAPTPTTTREQTPPSMVTVPTTTPLPVGPPLPAGHTRITIVLDDTGLHAPATFAAGDHIEFLFLDQRSQRGYMSWLTNDGGPMVSRWDGKTQTLNSYALKPGTTLDFHVLDESCACTLPGRTWTVSFT
jgi:hypothetical protein